MRSIRSSRLGLSLILIVAILGTAVILYQTRYGPGTTGDSVHYLMGAQNLLDGNGFSRTSGGGEIRPITMFPPFYSVILAGMKLVGLDPYIGVRVLHALLFGCNIFLVGGLIHRYTGSYWAALIGGLLILVARDLVYYHTWVLTEAIFILLMLLTVYGLAWYLDTRKAYLLVLTGILIGISTLTRYVGLSLTVAGLASIFLFSDRNLKRRMVDCMIFGGIALIPFFLWLRRNATITGTMVNREFIYHPISAELFQAYRAEITFWFVPMQLKVPHALRRALMLLLAIPVPAIFFYRKIKENFLKASKSRGTFWTLPWILGFFVLSYVGILFFNLTLLDAISDFNTIPRYLVPVYVAAVILFILAFHWLINWKKTWIILRVAALGVVLLLTLFFAMETFTILKDPVLFIGYTGYKQLEPGVVEMMDSIERSAPIISNDPEMVYILADRPAYLLPLQYDYHTTKEREDFDQQVQATREKLNQGGVIVLFSPMSESELGVVKLLDAERLIGFKGSLFYGYPEVIAE